MPEMRGKKHFFFEQPIFVTFICGNCGKNDKYLIINIIVFFLLTQIYIIIATLPQPLPTFAFVATNCHKIATSHFPRNFLIISVATIATIATYKIRSCVSEAIAHTHIYLYCKIKPLEDYRLPRAKRI